MLNTRPLIIVVLVGVFIVGFFLFMRETNKEVVVIDKEDSVESALEEKDDVLGDLESKFQGIKPKEWGEKVSGVYNRLDTEEKKIALTLDACEKKYDEDLLKYLMEEGIPATIFASGLWLDKFPEVTEELSENDLFTIENHGLNHKPCSVNGEYA